MANGRRVVVLVKPQLLTNDNTGRHAARILELGLTGYGATEEEALSKATQMYASAVHVHRELGTLQDWLSRSGLRWCWADEYDGPLPVINVDGEVTEPPMPKKRTTSNACTGSAWRDKSDLPMVA